MIFNTSNPFDIQSEIFNNTLVGLSSEEFEKIKIAYYTSTWTDLGNSEAVAVKSLSAWSKSILSTTEQSPEYEIFGGNLENLQIFGTTLAKISSDEESHVGIMRQVSSGIGCQMLSDAMVDQLLAARKSSTGIRKSYIIIPETVIREIRAAIIAGFQYQQSQNEEKKTLIRRQFQDEVGHAVFYNKVLLEMIFPNISEEVKKTVVLPTYMDTEALPWNPAGTSDLAKTIFRPILGKDNAITFFDSEYFNYALDMHVKYRYQIVRELVDISIDDFRTHLQNLNLEHLKKCF